MSQEATMLAIDDSDYMRNGDFLPSRMQAQTEALTKLAKRLKKEKVSVDAISFGENEVNEEKLSVFISTLNGKDGSGSHFVSVPPGSSLHDSLVSSPILAGENGSVGTPGLGLEFGLDANEDPDLLYALRVSLEDQRMRQEQEGNAGSGAAFGAQPLPDAGNTSDEAMLRQALELSMRMEPAPAQPPSGGLPMDVDLATMSEEDQIAYALLMSLQQSSDQPAVAPESAMEVDQVATTEAPTTQTTSSAPGFSQPDLSPSDLDIIQDVSFLQNVLKNLPDVDPQSEDVRKAIDALTKPKQDKKDTSEGTSEEKHDDKDEGSSKK